MRFAWQIPPQGCWQDGPDYAGVSEPVPTPRGSPVPAPTFQASGWAPGCDRPVQAHLPPPNPTHRDSRCPAVCSELASADAGPTSPTTATPPCTPQKLP